MTTAANAKKGKRPAPNPLAIDPTRTSGLRSKLRTEMVKRMKNLNAFMKAFLSHEKPFSLILTGGSLESVLRGAKGQRKPSTTPLRDDGDKWSFLQDYEKLTVLKNWLAARVEDVLLSRDARAAYGKILRSGFTKGAERSYEETTRMRKEREEPGADQVKTDLSYKAGFRAGTKAEFIKRLLPPDDTKATRNVASTAVPYRDFRFGKLLQEPYDAQDLTVNAPSISPANALQLIMSMTFDSISGITAAMSASIVQALSNGLIAGDSPYDIAKVIANLTGVSITKAERIARTAIIKAYAEGQLAALTDMGVTTVGAKVEFTATPDSRVCPFCIRLNKKVYKVEDAHGIIPLHPNCRCSWIPVLPDNLTDRKV